MRSGFALAACLVIGALALSGCTGNDSHEAQPPSVAGSATAPGSTGNGGPSPSAIATSAPSLTTSLPVVADADAAIKGRPIYFVPAGGQFLSKVARPRIAAISGDGDTGFQDARWDSWGETRATGQGAAFHACRPWNGCKKVPRAAVRLTLSHARSACGGVLIYTVLELSPIHAKDKAFAGRYVIGFDDEPNVDFGVSCTR